MKSIKNNLVDFLIVLMVEFLIMWLVLNWVMLPIFKLTFGVMLGGG